MSAHSLAAPAPNPDDPLDLDAEYNNRARVPEWEAILSRFARDAAAYRAQHRNSETGVRYGNHPRQWLDLFRADGSGNRAVVVFIHGGYWRSLDPSNFSHFASGLNARGVSVAMPAYRLCPEVTIGDIVADMRSACMLLHRTLGAPLVPIGWSAGGHLAACLAATDWVARGTAAQIVAAGLAISGLFELKPLLRTTINESLRLDEAAAVADSPVFWRPTAARFESFVGETESAEFHRQSRLIAERWSGKARTASHVISGANHFTAPEPLTDPASAMVETVMAMCEAAR